MIQKSRIAGLLATLVLLLGVAAVGWFRHRERAQHTEAALPSKSAEAPVSSLADQQLRIAERKVKILPNDPGPYVELATAYMHKARETGDGAYYGRAEAACKKALELDPHHYGAVRLVSWVYCGQHRFREALTAANKALEVDPGDPWNYGTLGDALVELGEYQQAVEAYQKMVDLRPDVNAYTRVAHIRELYGDPQGAIEIMGMAVRAASSRDREHSAWCRVQLGHLLFNSGRLADAQGQYQAALQIFPEYHFALAGMGKVRAAQEKFNEAIQFYQKSIDVLPTHESVAALVDLFTYLKRPEEAARQFELLETVERINRASGVLPESSTALFYADHDRRLDEALRIARQQANQRRDIRTLDTLAWVLFKNGHHEEALAASTRAMRLGTKDALMSYHHGMIQAKLGRDQEATAALQQALNTNPYFNLRHSEQARAALQAASHGVDLASIASTLVQQPNRP
jgi:tetratricopeptide (TPR) repeat protein